MIKQNNVTAFEELKEVLKKAGYSEQQIIDLLSRFLDENNPEKLDKTLVELLDSLDEQDALYEAKNRS